jgi:hypothetical protein
MRARLLILIAIVTAGFLVATNPVVADAARMITGKDIKNGSVSGKDIKNRSLTAKDLKKGTIVRGLAGAAGADGILANAWLDYDYARDSGSVPVALPNNGTYGDVVTLSGGPGQRSGPVAVTAAARLFVTATAYLNNGDGTGRALRCFLELRPVGGVTRKISFTTYDSLATFENKTLSVSTSEAVGPGTYDAALRCATQLNNANGRVFYASMSVLAVRDAA